MTTPEQVEATAKTLTKTDLGYVRDLPPSWFNMATDHPMTVSLRKLGLVRAYHHQFAPRMSMHGTPLALALCAHLKSKEQ